jgi:hypothetical protein
MLRLAGPLLVFAVALANTPANAQAGAAPVQYPAVLLRERDVRTCINIGSQTQAGSVRPLFAVYVTPWAPEVIPTISTRRQLLQIVWRNTPCRFVALDSRPN